MAGLAGMLSAWLPSSVRLLKLRKCKIKISFRKASAATSQKSETIPWGGGRRRPSVVHIFLIHFAVVNLKSEEETKNRRRLCDLFGMFLNWCNTYEFARFLEDSRRVFRK